MERWDASFATQVAGPKGPKGPNNRVPLKGYIGGNAGFYGNYIGVCIQNPNKRVLGPKYYSINGILALKPCYLGPWTLRVGLGLGG